MEKIEKEILKTLLFFNLFSRPLNLKELHQFLGVKSTEGQTFLALINLVKKGKVIEKNNFFVLKQYEKIFRYFKKREKIKNQLIKRAEFFSFLFKITPFIRGVFLVNSLAMGLPSKNSDIDVLVLTKKNRLWISRFFANILFFIFGQKRKKEIKKAPKKFCLSFFSEIDLDLSKWKLKGEDPLFIYWLATAKPLVGQKACQVLFEKNSWILKFLPNLKIKKAEGKIKPLSFVAFLLEKIINIFGDFLEKKLFQIQSKRIRAKNKKDEKLALPYIFKSYVPGEEKRFIKVINKIYKKYLLK